MTAWLKSNINVRALCLLPRTAQSFCLSVWASALLGPSAPHDAIIYDYAADGGVGSSIPEPPLR